ncbi:MAG: sensor histidine kinase, partial [Flavobacteriales bacterium]
SGIAHDLNTPIGAIKVGAENIRFTLESLFKEVIWKCSAEQIGFACNRAMHRHIDLFIGGLQQRKEIAELGVILSEKYKLTQEEIQNLAPLMVKTRLNDKDEEELQLILQASNRNEFLQLIYLIQTTRTFVDTIITSSEKAAKVVQNMKTFLKGHGSPVMAPVDLSENIMTVVNIFNYEIKRRASIEVELHDGLMIQGIANRLYQLWSNILKNAVESFHEQRDSHVIRITSEVKESSIKIIIGNNGPMIPPEQHELIFDKFYTTKSERDGTGLGLSIVKSIADDHSASIYLQSTSEWTAFTFEFSI